MKILLTNISILTLLRPVISQNDVQRFLKFLLHLLFFVFILWKFSIQILDLSLKLLFLLAFISIFLLNLLDEILLIINPWSWFTLTFFMLLLEFLNFFALRFPNNLELLREIILHLNFIIFQIFNNFFEILNLLNFMFELFMKLTVLLYNTLQIDLRFLQYLTLKLHHFFS